MEPYYIEAQERANDLINEVTEIIQLIEQHIEFPYTPIGLYQIFKKGIMPVPYLWEGRDEFNEAVKWKTNMVNGGVMVVNDSGKPIKPTERVKSIFLSL